MRARHAKAFCGNNHHHEIRGMQHACTHADMARTCEIRARARARNDADDDEKRSGTVGFNDAYVR